MKRDELVEQVLDERDQALHQRALEGAAERSKASGVTVCRCGEPIGAERLAAVPYTKRCLDCAKAECEPRFRMR